MTIFDCNPEWPLCLYDFTFKNRNDKYIAMAARRSLKDYVKENYFTFPGLINLNARHNFGENEIDVIRV